MENNSRVFFVLVEGSTLPGSIDDSTLYFVQGAKELYLGNKKIGDAVTVDFLGQNAGFHNSIYRGKYLGSSVTQAQWAAINSGTFDGLYIGDYWTIGGINYRIAAFDYYYNTGDTACTKHHVVLVPDKNMYAYRMDSSMYTKGLESAKSTIKAAFGEAHILNHRQYLQNATTSGHPSGGAWVDSEVELMTEENVYGCKIFGPIADGSTVYDNYTIDKSQYPLFRMNPNTIQMDRSRYSWYWLRDVVSSAYFADVNGFGSADYCGASRAGGVRPAFSIIA